MDVQTIQVGKTVRACQLVSKNFEKKSRRLIGIVSLFRSRWLVCYTLSTQRYRVAYALSKPPALGNFVAIINPVCRNVFTVCNFFGMGMDIVRPHCNYGTAIVMQQLLCFASSVSERAATTTSLKRLASSVSFQLVSFHSVSAVYAAEYIQS